MKLLECQALRIQDFEKIKDQKKQELLARIDATSGPLSTVECIRTRHEWPRTRNGEPFTPPQENTPRDIRTSDDRREWRYWNPERGRWTRTIDYFNSRRDLLPENAQILDCTYEHLDPSIFATAEHLGEGHTTRWSVDHRFVTQPGSGLNGLERRMFEGEAKMVQGRAVALHQHIDRTFERLLVDFTPQEAQTLVAVKKEFSLTAADFNKIVRECKADHSRLFIYATSAMAAQEVTVTVDPGESEYRQWLNDQLPREKAELEDGEGYDEAESFNEEHDPREYFAGEVLSYHFLDDPRDQQLDSLTHKAIERLMDIQNLDGLAATAKKIIEWQNQNPKPDVNFKTLWGWYQLRKELLFRRHGLKIAKAAKRLQSKDADLNKAAAWIAKQPEPARHDLQAEHKRAMYRRSKAVQHKATA